MEKPESADERMKRYQEERRIDQVAIQLGHARQTKQHDIMYWEHHFGPGFRAGFTEADRRARERDVVWRELLNFLVDECDHSEIHTVASLWREGNFDTLRKEWPEIPEAAYPKL